MSNEPVWVTAEEALWLHDQVIARHGGASGVRDQGLLESALGRPQQIAAYVEGADLARLAAAYAAAIARNHPFVDGNKRTAFATCSLFLRGSGLKIQAPSGDIVERMVALASSRLDEDAFAEWLRANLEQQP